VNFPRFNASFSRYLAEKSRCIPIMARTLMELTDAALVDLPRDVGLWTMRANVLLRWGNFPEAINAAAMAVTACPQQGGMKIFLAQLLELMPNLTPRQAAGVKDLYRAAIAVHPLKPHYRELYANFLAHFGVADPEMTPREWAASAWQTRQFG
jgi:predicted Zn-dependent protease